jgi:hypothetical protein
MFDSKERLFDHLEVHSETIEKQEKKPKRKTSASPAKSGN